MLQSPHLVAAPLDIPIPMPELHRIRVRDFRRMVDVGIFSEDDRIELLEGVLIPMSPMGAPHSWVVQELNRLIARALPDGYRVRPQLPVTLGEYSEPQPDLAVVTTGQGDLRTLHPESALLVIEVSFSSLRYDRSAKAPVYARFGIPEYWIVDVQGRAVEVYTDPDPASARYRSGTKLGPEDELCSVAVPLPAIRVVDILP
jgi:Uma2 family endonuclease